MKKMIFLFVIAVIAGTVAIFLLYKNDLDDHNLVDPKQQVIEKWIGQKIILHDSLPVYNVEKDKFYTFNNFNMNRQKIVVSIDADCFTCVEDFILWKKIIDEIKGFNIEFLFYLHTSDLVVTKQYLKRWNFYYPIILDKTNIFHTSNNISEEKMFRAMLLDKNNEVTIIGNPTINNTIKEFYYSNIK